MTPHPAKKSRILSLLASLAVLFVQVGAMIANSQRNVDNSVSVQSPTAAPLPAPSPTVKKNTVTVSKLKTTKKKVHTVSGATKKK